MDCPQVGGWTLTSSFSKPFPKVCPLLLLMDGHSSHFSLEVVQMAAMEPVILFILPLNTTQPIDECCFGPLKRDWQRACLEYMTGKLVT